MELPDAAIRWVLENNVASNIEFFRMSNVSHRFRQVIKKVLLERAVEDKQSTSLDSLLLPCMLREIIRGHETPVARSDTFCAAWFHPDGIVEQIVSLREEEKEEDCCASMQSHPSFAPGGEQNFSDSSPDGDSRSRRSRGSYKQRHRKTRSRSPVSRTLSEPSQLSANEIRCCKEWRGYREAMQVLRHFGASQAFVDDLIQSARNVAASREHSTANELLQDAETSLLHPLIARPTFAVRGATVARPDSYCFCRDAQEDKELKTTLDLKSAKEATGWKDIRQREYKQAVARIQKRRRDDQRAVLPRVLLPSDPNTVLIETKATAPAIPHTIQAVIPHGETDKDGATNDDTYRAANTRSTKPNYLSLSELFTTPIIEGSLSQGPLPLICTSPLPLKHSATVIGRHCRSVQFLNTDGSHAVCMTTPPFACGPLSLPITIFCVGVATEDGCFLSGLHHRFELGHMYPNTPAAEVSELSAVCIATDPWEDVPMSGQANGMIQNHVSNLDTLYDSSHDSDDSSCEVSDDDGTTTPNCECDYQRVERKLDMADRDDDDGNEKALYYGRLGPGTWHCYVAVVDGNKTQIRIDGLAENVTAYGCDDSLAKAMLDGLTLGSDHKWDLSLCCGFGSGGEGEGAIAELAVFHGCLDKVDVEAIESEMMQRHGIPALADVSTEERGRDYDWMRQAQALFVQSPSAEASFGNVPLRYMSRHRSVAWTQFNAVTGAAMIQQRIGARAGGDSSEW